MTLRKYVAVAGVLLLALALYLFAEMRILGAPSGGGDCWLGDLFCAYRDCQPQTASELLAYRDPDVYLLACGADLVIS